MAAHDSSHIDPLASQLPPATSLLEKETLWTVQEVARYLRLRPETVRAMARRGELPVVKLGRVWRFKPALVERWIQEASERSVDPSTRSG